MSPKARDLGHPGLWPDYKIEVVVLGGAENVLDGLGDAIVFRELGLEVLAAIGGEAVEADLAIGLGDTPLGGDPALEEYLLQGGIEEALFDAEDFAGEQVNTLGD